jgi:cytochrome c peroxidase
MYSLGRMIGVVFTGIALFGFPHDVHADAALREQATALFGRVTQTDPKEISDPVSRLGWSLFWDPRLSANGKVACASCHASTDWSADSRRFSMDARGKLTARHSQPVFNSMEQVSLRWTGDRADGAMQAEGSITGSMGFSTAQELETALRENGYLPLFSAAFKGSDLSLPKQYARALQTYQATLRTPAPFDAFLAGDDKALTDVQKDGLRTFIANGCAGCHGGPLLGGKMLQKFGLVKEYWTETKSEKRDEGRFLATKNEADRYVFRVPMLRNIAKTAPYFHDGSVASLQEAIRIMASVQLGKSLSQQEINSIAAFFDALSGEVPKNYAVPGSFPALVSSQSR